MKYTQCTKYAYRQQMSSTAYTHIHSQVADSCYTCKQITNSLARQIVQLTAHCVSSTVCTVYSAVCNRAETHY